MQQKLVDSLMQGLLDPRFQSLISEFYCVRDQLTIAEDTPLLECIQHLLGTVCTILQDKHSIQQMKPATSPNIPVPQPDLEEMLSCVHEVENFLSGPAFPDTATVLFILCSKLGLDDKDVSSLQATDIIRRLDDFLKLIGLQEVSILRLWENAIDELATQRTALFRAVMNVVQVVQRDCVVSA